MQEILNNTGNPPSSLPIYEHLYSFIDDVLCNFKPLSTTSTGNVVSSEDDITQDLVAYFEDQQEFSNHSDYSFKFENQSKQGGNKTDIGVRLGRRYSSTNRSLFCWIEAKRLPTPPEKDRDEREYVFVSRKKENEKRIFKGNGGIQRFKEGKHAPKLSYSIMIGYIQENDADYWLNKINGWINDLTITDSILWNESDYLQKQKKTRRNRYVSTHNRSRGLMPITLHHFWINLLTNQ
ncbi:MAG: hypothetical protein LBG96_03085 [Tannerella sp.]|jgi:hypothetical protein|nr:hypothetical protein [Tannerella sp.]